MIRNNLRNNSCNVQYFVFIIRIVMVLILFGCTSINNFIFLKENNQKVSYEIRKIIIDDSTYTLPIIKDDTIKKFINGCCSDILLNLLDKSIKIKGLEYCLVYGLLNDTTDNKYHILLCCAASDYVPVVLVVDRKNNSFNIVDISHGCCTEGGHQYKCLEELIIINKIPMVIIDKYKQLYYDTILQRQVTIDYDTIYIFSSNNEIRKKTH
jgi:hypothetical protein